MRLKVRKLDLPIKSDNMQGAKSNEENSWHVYDEATQQMHNDDEQQQQVQIVTDEEWPETERLLRAKLGSNNKAGFITLKHREPKKDDDPNHGWGGVSQLSSHVTCEGGNDGTFISQGGKGFEFGNSKRK